MNYFQPVYWHSGLYLQPQHLQLTDLQHQYWNYRHNALTMPFCWGVVRFEIDPHALQNEELSVIQAILVFPDGAFVDCEINGLLAPRVLQGLWQERESPMPIYVGVRQFHPGQANVSEVDSGTVAPTEIKRWTLQGNARLQRDLFGNGPDADIHTLRYDLRFFLHEELAETTGYTLLPVGQLCCRDGEIQLDNHYIPPCVTLVATSAIKNWVTLFCRDLMSKIRRLETLKIQGSVLTKCTPDEFRNLMVVLQTLCRHGAQLEHLRQTGQVHPWYFVGILRQLNSELQVLCPAMSSQESSELLATLNVAYDHHQLGKSLHQLSEQFTRLMHELLNTSGSRVALVAQTGNCYTTVLDNLAVARAGDIYLCLNSVHFSCTDEQFINQQNIKLCSPEQLNKLLSYSLPGIPLTYISRLPHNLSVRDDTYCFHVDRQHSLWRSAMAEKKVTLYWTNAPVDLHAELIWVGEE
ncbi:type VI secretion system baseplate subunit TssK [Enterobacteriaceae bacterium LUAb1]